MSLHTSRWLAFFACLTIGAAPAHAAPHSRAAGNPIPALVGIVTDSAGTPLANVQVIITSLNRVATTSASGAFVFRGLPAGHYHVDAILLGFARADAEVTLPESGEDVKITIVMRRTVLRLGGVVVAASPGGNDAMGITQSTIDLSGKELARALGASVAQTLSKEPGMAMRYAGPAATTPIIRGLSGERILVLQDGDRTGDLSAASSDHALSIDPLASNRIEVVRGPASLLYGTNALGGVVNVVSNEIPTSVPSRPQGTLAAMAERATPGGGASAQVTFPLGSSVALAVRGGGRTSGDGYVGGGARLLNSSLRNATGGFGLGYVGGGVSAGVAASRFDFRYGLPASGDDPELGGKIDGHRDQLRAKLEFGGGRNGPFRLVHVDGSAQWYSHDEVENTGAVGTSFALSTQTLNSSVKTSVGRVEGAVGINAMFKQYEASGDEALTPAATTSGAGLFIFQELPLGGSSSDDSHALVPRLQLGGRWDVLAIASKRGDPKFGAPRSLDFTNASGSIGVTIPFAKRVSLGMSAARAFRAPTVEELFSNAFHAAVGTYDVGNPSLRSEINQGVDAVLRTDGARVNAQLSAYANRVSNYIAPDIVKDTTTAEGVVPLNRYTQRSASLRGLEGRVEGTWFAHVVVGATGDIVRGRFTDGSPLPFMPAARLGGEVRWDRGPLTLSSDVRHAFAQHQVSGGSVDIPTASYTLINISLGAQLMRAGLVHSVTLRADNLGDVRYFDASSRIKSFAANPGRNLALVYRVLF